MAKRSKYWERVQKNNVDLAEQIDINKPQGKKEFRKALLEKHFAWQKQVNEMADQRAKEMMEKILAKQNEAKTEVVEAQVETSEVK